jgi:hypothetical protein
MLTVIAWDHFFLSSFRSNLYFRADLLRISDFRVLGRGIPLPLDIDV